MKRPRLRRPGVRTSTAWSLCLLAGCAGAPLPSAPSRPVPAAASPAPATVPVAAAGDPANRTDPSSTGPSAPPDTDPVEAARRRFAPWLEAFQAEARARGIDEATLRVLDGARFLPRVVQADAAQPEFVRALWDYLDAAVSPQRVEQGVQALATARAAADAAAARHGVPATVLVAIWGVESNFGTNTGDIRVIDALATLGAEGRRESWAREELVAALRIVQRGDIDVAHMVGSWAGAMGQTQFLPSKYLAVAEDGDGDGRRDIWGSLPDVFASTANLLSRAGWRADEPWGVEVRLPSAFDPARAEASVRQDSAAWGAEGVRTMDGALPPPLADASILLPAGGRGPAFLAGANFRALLRYNQADSYALAVGLLSQRIAGLPGVVAAWPRDLVPLTRSQVADLQRALAGRGFDAGAADGRVGPATRAALRQWQRAQGLPADGFPTLELLQRLQGP